VQRPHAPQWTVAELQVGARMVSERTPLKKEVWTSARIAVRVYLVLFPALAIWGCSDVLTFGSLPRGAMLLHLVAPYMFLFSKAGANLAAARAGLTFGHLLGPVIHLTLLTGGVLALRRYLPAGSPRRELVARQAKVASVIGLVLVLMVLILGLATWSERVFRLLPGSVRTLYHCPGHILGPICFFLGIAIDTAFYSTPVFILELVWSALKRGRRKAVSRTTTV